MKRIAIKSWIEKAETEIKKLLENEDDLVTVLSVPGLKGEMKELYSNGFNPDEAAEVIVTGVLDLPE